MERLIVISRSRPQIDLKECIGTYELDVVPPCLFASDATILLVYGKAKILHHIAFLVSNEHLVMQTPAMETSTSIDSNNEDGQEMEASKIKHAPDLTGINDTSPKVQSDNYRRYGNRKCNTQYRNNQDMQ